MADKLIVPIPEACEMLGGISRALAYQLIDAGALERVNIGRRAFITRASIEALASSGAPSSAA
ncbi:helix-turn-helix domain-containing protein [Gordonia paraffinivorans]|uniref:helix-turn-helix domain-containing protein n=1 Tax=Gordonia paraffinivorans TaxID=175628 RepID=UPI00215AAB12|nr:helix-turn-helix domain-containing protein [Gordonia paraffinivorans]